MKNNNNTKKADFAIIGGGASGLTAGATLSKSGKSVIILESKPRAGKKLLATGNGRCNLGHEPLEMRYYHGDVALAKKVFAKWKGARAFFAELGVITRCDDSGRLYPYSNTAATVLDCLRFACDNANCEILTDILCNNIIPTKTGFICKTEHGEIAAKNIIWASGNADLSPLEKLGHNIIPPHPALCPIVTAQALTRPLKGLRVRAVCTAVADGKPIKTEAGEVQFNDGALSGICIMNLSRLVKDYGNSLTISLDIAPEFTAAELRNIPITGLFHKRIAEFFLKKQQPIERVKDWRFPVTGVADMKQAQIMAGGVPAAELNADNLSSALYPNLYIIGEAVNVDGDCGGYNLEWAWASASYVADNL